MSTKSETWCDRDEHKIFEHFVDFNEWLESDEGADLREENKIDGLSQPSKAFFAGDKEAYGQAFQRDSGTLFNNLVDGTLAPGSFSCSEESGNAAKKVSFEGLGSVPWAPRTFA